MNAVQRLATTALIGAVAAACLATGCDDEFDDAEAVTASEYSAEQAEQAAPEEPAYGEEGEGQARDSPGPIEGSERPPGHPTLDDEQGGQGGSAAPQGGSAAPQGGGMDAPAPQIERPEPESYGQAGPILWDAPSQWEPLPPSNEMRFAEYDVPAEEGTAELAVFYFGPEGGGGADATISRWAGEFSGGPEPTQDEIEVNGMSVDTVEASGSRQPTMAVGDDDGPQDDQRLLGAVADTSQGHFFFRMTGDDSAVSEHRDGFQSFVESFEDGEG